MDFGFFYERTHLGVKVQKSQSSTGKCTANKAANWFIFLNPTTPNTSTPTFLRPATASRPRHLVRAQFMSKPGWQLGFMI